jgi:hypothetical protein
VDAYSPIEAISQIAFLPPQEIRQVALMQATFSDVRLRLRSSNLSAAESTSQGQFG